MADQKPTYLRLARRWNSMDTRSSTSVWSTTAAAWATGSMLIQVTWISTVAAN